MLPHWVQFWAASHGVNKHPNNVPATKDVQQCQLPYCEPACARWQGRLAQQGCLCVSNRWDLFLHIPEPLRLAASATRSLFSHAGSDHSQDTHPGRHHSSCGASTHSESPKQRQTTAVEAAAAGSPRQPGPLKAVRAAVPSRLGSLATAVPGGFWKRDGSSHSTSQCQGAVVMQQAEHSATFAGLPSEGVQVAVEHCMLSLTGDQLLDSALSVKLRPLHPHFAQGVQSPPSTSWAACTSNAGLFASSHASDSPGAPTARKSHHSWSGGLMTPTAAAHRPGRVSLPGHTQLVRGVSALLTGMVLPERPAFHQLCTSCSYSQEGSMESPIGRGEVGRTASFSRRHSYCGDNGDHAGSIGIPKVRSQIIPSTGRAASRGDYSRQGRHSQGSVNFVLFEEPHMHASDPGTAVRLEGVQTGLAEPTHAQNGPVHHSRGPMLLVGPHGEVSR